MHNLKRLAAYVERADESIPIEVVQIGEVYLEQIAQHADRIKVLEKTVKGLAETSETSRRLRTVPGVGPITAMAIEAFAPEM
ncbi:MAG: IS110 family transposase, partial [Roseobacter sp.]